MEELVKAQAENFNLNYSFGVLHRHANLKIESVFHSVLKLYKLSTLDWIVLDLINQELSSQQIIEKLRINKSLVSKSIKKLKRQKLIIIEIDPEDKRTFAIFLTYRGEIIHKNCSQRLDVAFKKLMYDVSYFDFNGFLKTIYFISKL